MGVPASAGKNIFPAGGQMVEMEEEEGTLFWRPDLILERWWILSIGPYFVPSMGSMERAKTNTEGPPSR
jgi:hypothetical protein